MDSILTTIKKMIGIDVDDTDFDLDLTIHINTAMFTLSQMGIGPSKGFSITSSNELWSNYITDPNMNLEGVKSYIYLKTKLAFDPPANSTIVESINKLLSELEWRMMLNVETKNLGG